MEKKVINTGPQEQEVLNLYSLLVEFLYRPENELGKIFPGYPLSNPQELLEFTKLFTQTITHAFSDTQHKWRSPEAKDRLIWLIQNIYEKVFLRSRELDDIQGVLAEEYYTVAFINIFNSVETSSATDKEEIIELFLDGMYKMEGHFFNLFKMKFSKVVSSTLHPPK